MSGMLPLLIWLAKATALLVLATGITLVLRRAPAGARYIVWLATLVALLLVPAVSSWAPIPLPILPAEVAAPVILDASQPVLGPAPAAPVRDCAAVLGARDASRCVPTAENRPAAQRLGREQFAERSTMDPLTMLGVAWAVVGALVLAWLLFGALAVRRIVRRGRVLDDESWLSPMYDVADRLDLEQAPRVVMSSAIEMPFACGIFKPTIVLPAVAEQWSEERRRVVLFHELAHIRRRDLLGHTLGRVVCALYWFHPLVWSAAKRLRAESERACDDLVLACGGARASDYASHLLDIVTAVRRNGAPAPALPMADKKEFEGRMLAILDPALSRNTPSRSHKLLLALGFGAVALSIAAVAPVERPADTITSSRVEPTPAVQMPVADAAPRVAVQHVARRDTTKSPSTSPTTSKTESNTTSATETNTVTTSAEAAVSKLTSALGTAASQTFVTGLQRAVQQRVPADTALLGKVLRTDRDPEVRKAAAWALQGQREGIPLLIERLRQDRDDEVREMAAWALAGLYSEETAAALGEALKRDENQEVRATAAWALGHRQQTDIAALESALGDPSAEVRQRALWAIGQQRLSSAPPRVVAMLKDSRAEVRLMTAWVLGNVLDKATIPALREAFIKETDDESMQAEFRALLFMGDRSQAVIDRAMSSDKAEMRARAVRMIAGTGPGIWPWPWPWPQPRPEP